MLRWTFLREQRNELTGNWFQRRAPGQMLCTRSLLSNQSPRFCLLTLQVSTLEHGESLSDLSETQQA